MKKTLSALLVVSLLFSFGCRQKSQDDVGTTELKGTITLSGAWALYPMVVKWGEEFQKIHPNVRIDIAAGGAGKGMADALAKVVDLGMVSREIYPEEVEKGAWWVSVTKDAVVPTINEENPVLENLLIKGIKKETLTGIWITGKIKNWREVIEGEDKHAIHIYTRSDACGAAKTWAKFLGGKQEDLLGIGVYGDPGVAEAVRKDNLGIGYNNINYAYDSKTKKQIKGITVVPVDFNGNGKINEDENFFETREDIVKAISTGKYPSPPARDLHLVSQGKPGRKVVIEFLKWVLTKGQQYIPEAGYIDLEEKRLEEELKKFEGD